MNIAKFLKQLFWRSLCVRLLLTRHKNSICFLFLKKFPSLRFLSIFSESFWWSIKKLSLIFSLRLCLTNITNILFYKQLGSGPCSQSCLYFKISRPQSCLTFGQYFEEINVWVYSSDFLAFVIDIMFTVSQRSKQFYEIRGQVICINMKAFNRVNRKQFKILKTLLEYLEIILLLTEDDSALKVA